ncbi:zinc-dependent alcohol dehydrogenase family protein [soil metagenome]
MQAAVFAGEGRLSLEERPRPQPEAADEVLIAVEACGICGTDLQILATPPGHPATPGTILGHELVGRVVEVGSGAGHGTGGPTAGAPVVPVGTRVVVDADPKCGSCDPCRSGRPADCLNVQALGIFRDGALASHMVAPAATLYPIGEDVPAHIAALAEPLACVVNGTRKAALRPGESAVIFGAGAIGCLFLAVLRASGGRPIVVVEPSTDRAAVASAMGADEVVAPADLRAAMQRILPAGADVVVDAVGSVLPVAIEVAARGARVILFGMNGTARPLVHQVEITQRSLTIMGTYISNFTFPEAVRLLESGRLDLAPMVSAVLSLARAAEAFELLGSGRATKVVIRP